MNNEPSFTVVSEELRLTGMDWKRKSTMSCVSERPQASAKNLTMNSGGGDVIPVKCLSKTPHSRSEKTSVLKESDADILEMGLIRASMSSPASSVDTDLDLQDFVEGGNNNASKYLGSPVNKIFKHAEIFTAETNIPKEETDNYIMNSSCQTNMQHSNENSYNQYNECVYVLNTSLCVLDKDSTDFLRS